MAVVGKILAQGTLSSSDGTLVTVPSATNEWVTSIKVSNVGMSSRTFSISVKKSGGTLRNYSGTIALAAGDAKQVLDSAYELRLGAGDEIHGVASADTDLEYTICAGEVT